MAYVYKHIRLDKNEVFYIGIGGGTSGHQRAHTLTGRNKFWYNIIKKTDFNVEIVYDNIPWEEACEKEIQLISEYKKRSEGGSLVNLTKGGEGFSKNHDEKTKFKISKKLKNKTYEDIHGIGNADLEREKRRESVKRYWDNISDEEYNRRIQNKIGKGKPHSGNEKPIECPHCKKIGRASCMVRWHFDNCTVFTGKKHNLNHNHKNKTQNNLVN